MIVSKREENKKSSNLLETENAGITCEVIKIDKRTIKYFFSKVLILNDQRLAHFPSLFNVSQQMFES